MGKVGSSADLDQALLPGAGLIPGSWVSGWVSWGRPILHGLHWGDHALYHVVSQPSGSQPGLVFWVW